MIYRCVEDRFNLTLVVVASRSPCTVQRDRSKGQFPGVNIMILNGLPLSQDDMVIRPARRSTVASTRERDEHHITT